MTADSPAPLLELRGISKRLGRVRALRDIDLTVRRGEALAILGSNGAGKTTLLRVIAGLTRPNGGTMLVDGRPVSADPASFRRRLGHVSHQTMLHDALTARENLTFAGRLHGVPQLRTRIDQLLRGLDLGDRGDEPVRQLSRGLQQRVAIARALLHDPEMLLLDEPTTGLDRQAGETLVALLAAVRRRGRTLLLVTHDVEKAVQSCDRAVVLHRGRLITDHAGSPLPRAALEAALAAASESAATATRV